MINHLSGCSMLFLVLSTSAMAAQQPVKMPQAAAADMVPDRQIHAFASALLEIEKIKQAVSFRAAKLTPDEAALLKSRSQAGMIRILKRHDLDVPTFNRISARVDEQRRLRREVKQLMMEEQLAI